MVSPEILGEQREGGLPEYLLKIRRHYLVRIAEIEAFLKAIAQAFVASQNEKGYWDAEYSEEKKAGGTIKNEVSLSTQAMCIVAIEKVLETLDGEAQKQLKDTFDKGKQFATEEVSKKFQNKDLTSTTYGNNSPVLCYWLDSAKLIKSEDLKNFISEDLKRCIENPHQPDCLPIKDYPNNLAGPHAFPLLGTVRLAQSLGIIHSFPGWWFERRMNEQLAYERFQDFRFDAAELTFSLQGALICGTAMWESKVIRQVLDVVRVAQKRSVYWRPYRPFRATKKGDALLNLSVEVANALIDIIQFPREETGPRVTANKKQEFKEKWNKGNESIRLFKENEESLEEYYNWLIAQRRPFGKKDCEGIQPIGWLSENVQVDVDKDPKMHTWATAQVALFLAKYKRILNESYWFELIHRSRFSLKEPGHKNVKMWDDLVAMDRGRLKEGKRALDIIEKFYIKPWQKEGGAGENRRYSMLLYGPPGTSKTTIAEAIAGELGWPFITISPSDFLAEGMEQIEYRAKTIFEILTYLDKCVVLFDEIDQLLMDREAASYKELEGVLKLMTPSMLVKLNDLRKGKHLIFIVGTNYADQIDDAIKRRGRFDDQFLILPFDLEGRKELIPKLAKAERIEITGEEVTKLSFGSVLGVYEEIKDLVDRIWVENKGRSDRIEKSLRDFNPSMGSFLERRFRDLRKAINFVGKGGKTGELDELTRNGFDRFPFEEMLCLIGLLLEVPNSERERFASQFNELLNPDSTVKEALRKEFNRIYDHREDVREEWIDRLKKWLN